MAKFLVTGGSGFIGTNLISTLHNKGHEVLNIDILKPKLCDHNVVYKQINLCNFKELEYAMISFNPDFVIHLGARTDLNGKTLNDYEANIQGVKNILEVLDKLNNLQCVVFTSSMYVCQPGYIPVDYEDYKPHTIYGESKVMTEKIIKEKNPSYTWTIIRPTSIWGPYFGEPYNLFFKIVLSHKYFHMGNKTCKKTYGYIDNFIYQLLSIINAEKNEINKNTFYLGDYQPYDITSWANEIAENKQINIPKIPYSFFKVAGFFGDCLKLFGVKFPMTSFRLKNMTTNNIFDLSEIEKIAPKLPKNRIEATKITVDWLDSSK